ncbi:TetR/AcrR family transcriptional regulator [Bacillus vallismortis]|uniref:TetR/AcrR family transcriptional regulator n=1 Tax=Bacillus TaxID=1386 RepID=UPI00057BF2AA|nr:MULTISPECIES: TetR/AcrR family transcriptional regulator [Bacillus]PJZ00741.1 TetR/AcrR family transcriptional regulator [Bacillus vallismortis]
MVGKAKRYQELLNAARSVLAEKGFEETKVSEIVQRAGVAKGTFYLYFPSKLDLVLALVREMQQNILSEAKKAIDSKISRREELMRVIKAAFNVMERYNDVFPVFNAVTAFKTDQWKAEREIRTPYYSFLKSLIKNGQTSAEFKSDLDPEIASLLIVGMVEHAAHECFVYDSDFRKDKYLYTIDQLLSRALCKSC